MIEVLPAFDNGHAAGGIGGPAPVILVILGLLVRRCTTSHPWWVGGPSRKVLVDEELGCIFQDICSFCRRWWVELFSAGNGDINWRSSLAICRTDLLLIAISWVIYSIAFDGALSAASWKSATMAQILVWSDCPRDGAGSMSRVLAITQCRFFRLWNAKICVRMVDIWK